MLNVSVINATHYRAGEISYEQISDLTIRVTLTTYTKTSSISADSDSITIDWGDGATQVISRTIIGGTSLANNVKISYFIEEHTYPGRATYTIGFTDPNRTSNILNINWPNSVDVPFYISTTFTLLDTQFQGKNSSVILLQPPIDIACVGQPFIHNPNAYDPDGDSLVYELIKPLAGEGEEVPLYRFPSEVEPGIENQIYLNSKTGNFTWLTPQIQGEYNIAILIKEFRNGVLINSMMRDMQVLVRGCNNLPHEIDAVTKICVVAGEVVDIPLVISDPDVGQMVQLNATGGIFDQAEYPATLDVDPIYMNGPFNANFSWQTACSDIRQEEYQVVFRAVDDFLGESGLATLKTLRIKVVGPPPKIENLDVENDIIHLEWINPYDCEDARDGYFQGFSVWRKEGASTIVLDSCTEGVGESSYIQIKAITLDKDADYYYYDDIDIEPYKSYCYRVLGEFAHLSDVGYPYNPISSLRSNEVCATLTGNVPTITQVSVLNTDISTGAINIKWIAPSPILLDTNEYKGPYKYELSRAKYGSDEFQLIPEATQTHESLLILDTFEYVDNGLNTFENQYNYQLDFFIEDNIFFGSSSTASSMLLSINPFNESVELTWQSETPWVNQKFYIWKYNENIVNFELLDSTIQRSYIDKNLKNGNEYCYKIESSGTFSDGIRQLDNIINFSQEACATPIDNNPPCKPFLNVESICDLEDLDLTSATLANHLYWSDPNTNCAHMEEIASYNIYYKSNVNGEFEVVANIQATDERIYDHFPLNTLAGCYAVTAIDKIGNESSQSNIVCVDNCPLYELPNTFTPNGDGHNDIFKPLKNYFISTIDFKLYNRWNALVFETTDPEINWDGNSSSGNPLSPGVYYYKCIAIESRVDQSNHESFELNGVIHLIRGE